jgi:translation initiation factor 4E
MTEIEYPTKDKWTLWFHKVNDDKWDLESYQKLYTLIDLEDFHAMFNTFFNNEEKMTANAGMFFLMKDDITPMWEDSKNITGGMWSYKAAKKEGNLLKSDIIWKKLVAACLGSCLTKNPDDMKYITGISISPKLDNCIFKIWNNDSKKSDASILADVVEGLDHTKTLYKKCK